jgi:hypothetical protein
MEKYDPQRAPDPEAWQSLDEQECIDLVMAYHRRAGVELPNELLHGVMHAVVENQILMGDEISTGETVERLMGEGLDRHDAIHAVGSVVAGFLHQQMTSDSGVGNGDAAVANARLNEEIRNLTAARWLEEYSEEA